VIGSEAELHSLVADWGSEPVVVQRTVRDDGWEHKVWVIGDQLHCVRRRSQFGERVAEAGMFTPLEQLSGAIAELAREVGAVFGLELYGVDVLAGEHGPVVVDVNPFPGFRRMPYAGELLAARVMHLARRARVPT
jgi:ribosomal protein S6--L-glutamate ligase